MDKSRGIEVTPGLESVAKQMGKDPIELAEDVLGAFVSSFQDNPQNYSSREAYELAVTDAAILLADAGEFASDDEVKANTDAWRRRLTNASS